MPRKPRSNPRIFLSYARKDTIFSTELAKRLRRAMKEEEAVWYDSSLRGGENWWDRIKKQLRSSSVFIVVLSPDAIKSKWVKQEINIAWWRHVHKRMRFIPVLHRECKVPLDLNTLHIISFTSTEDYDTSLQKLLETLNLPQYVNASSIFTRDSENEKNEHIQEMTQYLTQAFDNEDWHYVIAVTKAIITRYSEEVPASIYQMQGFAYIYADRIYVNQYQLAQDAIKAALLRVDDTDIRLSLLDIYAFTLISRNQWDEAETCAKEALQLTSNSHIWQLVQEVAHKKSGQNGFLTTSPKQDILSSMEIMAAEPDPHQNVPEAQSVLITRDQSDQNTDFELEKQEVEIQKARFEFEKERMTFALEIGDIITEKLYPGTDKEARAKLLKNLFPQLLQLGSHKTVELVFPFPECIRSEATLE